MISGIEKLGLRPILDLIFAKLTYKIGKFSGTFESLIVKIEEIAIFDKKYSKNE